MPDHVKCIIATLNKKGFSAYVVGGCVRDSLLGVFPSDWDICTDALPEQTKQVFEKTFDTGLKHGTVSVMSGGEIFEITTFRQDGDYKDNRHPQQVSFTSDIKTDLARRDFTINAMAYNDTDGLIDPFGGVADLDAGIIRCVGNPDVRFSEDALRILRAIRFAAQKNFVIEEKTLLSIRKNSHLVQNLSAERIISEITKILLSDNINCIKHMDELGVLQYIMPEMCRCFKQEQNIKWHLYDVGTHSLKAVEYMDKMPYLRFSALMHDWGKPDCFGINPDGSHHFRQHAIHSIELAENFLNRYKFSNADKSKILRLIKFHDREILPEKKCVKRAVNQIGDDIFLDLLTLKRADCRAQNIALTAPRLSIYDEIEHIYRKIKEDNESFSLKDLAVNGHDLAALGYQGREIGALLNSLLEHVIDVPEDNTREILLKRVGKP